MNIKSLSKSRLLLFVFLAVIAVGSLALSTPVPVPTAECQSCQSCVSACHDESNQLYHDCVAMFGEQAWGLCSEWSQEYFQGCICRNCYPIGCCPACTTQECEGY